MGKDQLQYFHIEKSHLKDDKIFGFNLYIYHPVSKSYTIYLHGNSPLTREKEEFMDFMLEKGGQLAVSLNQSKTFLRSMEYQKEDIPSLKTQPIDELEKQQKEMKELLEQESEDLFPFKEILSQSALNNNFKPLIQRARLEIMTFSPRISVNVSTASYLAEHLLKEDNHLNRTVALCYFIAKNMDIKDESTLAAMVCASYFAHIGQTGLDLFFSRTEQLKLSPKQKNRYQKHPGLAHHLMRKSKADIDTRVFKIIEDHHERQDGRGYPRGLMGANLDTLAMILGAVSHILEYSSGRITGSPVPLSVVLRNMKDKTFTAGLEFQFGDKIYDNLVNLLTSSPKDSEAA